MFAKKKSKNIQQAEFQMVTHSSTSRPVQCLCIAERMKYFLLTRKSNSRIRELSYRIQELFIRLRKQITCENGIQIQESQHSRSWNCKDN